MPLHISHHCKADTPVTPWLARGSSNSAPGIFSAVSLTGTKLELLVIDMPSSTEAELVLVSINSLAVLLLHVAIIIKRV